MRPVHWIERELSRHYKNLDLTRGADLDRNGTIEGSERTDLNGDGNVDSAEWQKFVGDNKAALQTLGGHFKTYYSAGSAFKPDNPIHDLLSIESELASPEEVNKAYEKVKEILDIARERLAGAKLKPEKILRLVYDSMKRIGIELKEQGINVGFINNISRSALDCDTSSFVTLAVAHELSWPVYLVSTPGHIFVRWDDDDEKRFNMDGGRTNADEYYLRKYNISQHAIDQGVHMKNLGYDSVLSIFYSNRGSAKDILGRHEESITDYNTAIELDPNNAAAYDNRGNAELDLKRYEEAIRDYDTAIELDPNDPEAYYNRGNAKLDFKIYEEAIDDYDTAIDLNPNYAKAYMNRGNAKGELGRYEEAIDDYDKAIKLDRHYAIAYHNRAIAEQRLGRDKEAIRDRERVLKLKSSPSCLCNAVGQAGNSSASDPSLLSLLLTVIFE
ncbi:MAG: tetratricopeptide repeat protein [bacterium]